MRTSPHTSFVAGPPNSRPPSTGRTRGARGPDSATQRVAGALVAQRPVCRWGLTLGGCYRSVVDNRAAVDNSGAVR